MQRLASLTIRSSSLIRFTAENLISAKRNELPLFTVNRFLSKQDDSSQPLSVDPRAKVYKPSSGAEQSSKYGQQKGSQPGETIESISHQTPSGKVWSPNENDSVHVVISNPAASPKISSDPNSATKSYNAAVYSTKGHVNLSESFKLHSAPIEPTVAQIAEAAAASAFEPALTDAELKTSTNVNKKEQSEKTASVKPFSTVSSIGDFDISSPSGKQTKNVYEISQQGKVFGGQDTLTTRLERPNENPFNLKEKISTESKK